MTTPATPAAPVSAKLPARALFLPVGDERTASTRYRVLSLLPALRAAGWDAAVRHPFGEESAAPRRLARAVDLLRDTFGARPADVVVVHRKTFPPLLASRLRRRGQPLLFDFDDALDLPPPGRDAGAFERQRYARNFHATVAAADIVLCGNEELARRAAHPRSEILPTSVDTARFRPGAVTAPAEPVLGWIGYSDNLRYLEELDPVFARLRERHPGLRLVVGADRAPSISAIPVEFRRWSLDTELSIFDGIGVGLMPLHDDEWTRGKCAFKALQYMALGVPTVASPVGANREVIEDGVSGFLPPDTASWVAALDRLLADRPLAGAISAAGREVVLRRYSLDVVSRRLLAILAAVRGANELAR